MTMGIIRRASLGLAVPTTSDYSDTETSAAPSTSASGVDCKGYSQVLVGVHGFTTVSVYSLRPYLYIEESDTWLRLTDADGAPVEYTGLDGSTPVALAFGCAGADRFAVHVSSVTPDGGATYEISTTLRPCGPGL